MNRYIAYSTTTIETDLISGQTTTNTTYTIYDRQEDIYGRDFETAIEALTEATRLNEL